MGYKEYIESEDKLKERERKKRHRFFAQHPGLAGTGLLPLGETQEESETKIIYQDMEWTSRQWDAVQQLNAQVLYFGNKLNEHMDTSKRGDKDPF